jgi:hypothetical protein
MSILDRVRKNGTNAAADQQPGVGSPAYTEMHQRRDELAAIVAEMTWDLGGLTYEMAVRDHFRIDVLVRRAAELQEVDAQLGEVERLLAADYEGISGGCRACGAPHSRGAVYCWQCGMQLLQESQSAIVTGVTAPTTEIPAQDSAPLQVPEAPTQMQPPAAPRQPPAPPR